MHCSSTRMVQCRFFHCNECVVSTLMSISSKLQFLSRVFQTQDPFWEPLDTPTLIGVAYIPLESISYMLDIGEQKIGIYDYQARHVGFLSAHLIPCEADGEENSEDLAVEEPIDLVGVGENNVL